MPLRGEVWQADLGIAAKVRPVLVVSAPLEEGDYALVTVIPRTTSDHGSQYELAMTVPGLKEGTFNLQALQAVPLAKFLRLLAKLTPQQMDQVDAALKRWLTLP